MTATVATGALANWGSASRGASGGLGSYQRG